MVAATCVLAADAERKPLLKGVDANYSLNMEKDGMKWTWDGTDADLFEGMAKQGVGGIRVRLWTNEVGPHGRAYATALVKRSLRAGLDPYLVIFLSDDWSDLEKQPVPAKWKELSYEERLSAVKKYSRESVAHFRREGLRSHLYEIGNEIDFGICGEYPGRESDKNPDALEKSCWPRSARIILASQEGIRAADPDAQFMLHIAHWWDVDFCLRFFQFMLKQGVQIDYAGLSYFPSSNIGGFLEMEQFGGTVSQLVKGVNRPVIVAETAYPGTKDFGGQFGAWKHEVPGYPLTPEGQKRWLTDFFQWCGHNPGIFAVYYWSPEWCGDGMWKGFALFEPDGKARPAWDAFGGSSGTKKVWH